MTRPGTLSISPLVKGTRLPVRSRAIKAAGTMALLSDFGPPNEWSGAVAAALGADRRKLLTAAWDAMGPEDRAKVMERFAASWSVSKRHRVRKDSAGDPSIDFQGLDLRLDRPRGYVMRGRANDGTEWVRRYLYDYGYIPSTEGGDGEGLDVFVGPTPTAPIAWWAVQVHGDTGEFDEFKVFLGFATEALARSAYALHIPPHLAAAWFSTPVGAIKSILGIPPEVQARELVSQLCKRFTKLEAHMAVKKKKSASGSGEILTLAARRLAAAAAEVSKGDGSISKETASELSVVKHLVDTTLSLYAGGEDPEASSDPEAMDAVEAALEMSETEKALGIVRMSPEAFVDFTTKALAKAAAEPDVVKRAASVASLQKALQYANFWATNSFQETGTPPGQIPVVVSPDQVVSTEVSTPTTAAASTSGLNPAAAGGATGVGGATSQTAGVGGSSAVVEKLAAITKSIASFRGAKGTTEAVQKSAPQGELGLWPASYVNTLPDSAFLYVEQGANKSVDGSTAPAFRHFPIRDASGALSSVQLSHAIKSIPTFGATAEFKAELLKKAEGLFGLESMIAKSASTAAARGDDGWPVDIASDEYLHGRRPSKAVEAFGFDSTPSKRG